MSEPTASKSYDQTGGAARENNAIRCTVVSVERSEGPDGATGDDWYRYVIEKPGSPITGYRRGKKKDVLEYLNECMSQLEERMTTGKAPKARGRKPKQAET